VTDSLPSHHKKYLVKEIIMKDEVIVPEIQEVLSDGGEKGVVKINGGEVKTVEVMKITPHDLQQGLPYVLEFYSGALDKSVGDPYRFAWGDVHKNLTKEQVFKGMVRAVIEEESAKYDINEKSLRHQFISEHERDLLISLTQRTKSYYGQEDTPAYYVVDFLRQHVSQMYNERFTKDQLMMALQTAKFPEDIVERVDETPDWVSRADWKNRLGY